MHYKNGREAKNGDKVVTFPTHGVQVVGILHGATAGNNYCNGQVAPLSGSVGVNLRECLHFDDVKAAVEASGVIFDNKDEPSS